MGTLNGTSGSEYIVSPRSTLKWLFSASIDPQALKFPQYGVEDPGLP